MKDSWLLDPHAAGDRAAAHRLNRRVGCASSQPPMHAHGKRPSLLAVGRRWPDMGAKMFKGRCLRIVELPQGLAELCFDRADARINKLDATTRTEFALAIQTLKQWPGLRGVLLSSAKPGFIVGADITEFGALFRQQEAAIASHMMVMSQLLCDLEDLPVPTVAAINGHALGGGLEVALACSMRVMSIQASVGLPEVGLGLLPAYGGTVRLARIAGLAVALDWVCSGDTASATTALDAGVVDQIAAPHELRAQALAILAVAAANAREAASRQERKRRPVDVATDVVDSLFDPARLRARAREMSHQPAARVGVDMMRVACREPRQAALQLEAAAFARVAKTQAAAALVQTFLNQQAIRKAAKVYAQSAQPVHSIAVLGAGIMGAGIAFASARHGVPVLLVDIAQPALDIGMHEARRLFDGLVSAGHMDAEAAARALASITPQIGQAGCEAADLVIEAISENLDLKQRVLAELERRLPATTLLASNTSGLRIADIASSLQRPENLVAMHFFNPVATMPLVEVGQGPHSDAAAVATVVGFAQTISKMPIVVKDSPGFLVNRVFTAYMQAFQQLLIAGADFTEVDHAMEAFGWPLGPAGLLDMLGLDICLHAGLAISAGYPANLPHIEHGPLALLVAAQRLGRKNGTGFYRYVTDVRGRRRKLPDDEVASLLAQVQPFGRRSFEPAQVVDRMMLAMVLESCRTLDHGVATGPAELDLALLTGAGVPAYLGGPLIFADWLGAPEVLARADRLAALGPMYHAPESLREMARSGASFYPG